MRTQNLQIEFGANLAPAYVDVDVEGTALDGITAGTPVAVTVQQDVPSFEPFDAAISVRVSATNTLRFRSCAPPTDPISVTVVELV